MDQGWNLLSMTWDKDYFVLSLQMKLSVAIRETSHSCPTRNLFDHFVYPQLGVTAFSKTSEECLSKSVKKKIRFKNTNWFDSQKLLSKQTHHSSTDKVNLCIFSLRDCVCRSPVTLKNTERLINSVFYNVQT